MFLILIAHNNGFKIQPCAVTECVLLSVAQQ